MQPISDVDLRLLRIFITVVDCGGFSAAQNELGLSQSTVSNHMAALETRLGYALCKRGRGGFELTPRGSEIYESTKDLFQHLSNFSTRVHNLKERLSGELIIGSLDATVTDPQSPLRHAIRSFNRRKNDVHIVLGCYEPGELERRVVQGRIHLAIGTFHKRVDGLAYLNLYKEKQVLYCAADHPLASRRNGVSEAELNEFGMCIRGYWGHRHVFDFGGEKFSATCFDMESQLSLILSGGYIGFLPAHFAQAWEARGELVAIMPDKYNFFCKFLLAFRRETLMNHIVKTFVDELTRIAGDWEPSGKQLIGSARRPEDKVARRGPAPLAEPAGAVRRAG